MHTKDPYLLLGIDENTTDKAVTAAYHRALRRYPPEQEPDQFALISEAYEAIKTEEQRVRRRLFPPQVEPTELAGYFDVPGDVTPVVNEKKDVWLREARRQWARKCLS